MIIYLYSLGGKGVPDDKKGKHSWSGGYTNGSKQGCTKYSDSRSTGDGDHLSIMNKDSEEDRDPWSTKMGENFLSLFFNKTENFFTT